MTNPFTDTYIAMAKAAEEIQAMRPDYDLGDWYWFTFNDGSNGPFPWTGEDNREAARPWLPRLDQLLGMLGSPSDFLREAESPDDDFHAEYRAVAADWHELALAVVMRTKHGKVWRDGQWMTT